VQRGDVAMADGLLPAGVFADALDWQIDLDEALGARGHEGLRKERVPIVTVNLEISILWLTIISSIKISIDLSTSR